MHRLYSVFKIIPSNPVVARQVIQPRFRSTFRPTVIVSNPTRNTFKSFSRFASDLVRTTFFEEFSHPFQASKSDDELKRYCRIAYESGDDAFVKACYEVIEVRRFFEV